MNYLVKLALVNTVFKPGKIDLNYMKAEQTGENNNRKNKNNDKREKKSAKTLIDTLYENRMQGEQGE